MKERVKKPKRIYSPTKRRVLLLLQTGVALSFAGTLGKQFKIVNQALKEWQTIDRQYLYRVVHEFYRERLIGSKDNPDGTRTFILTEKGRERIIKFDLDRLTIPGENKWNGKWHGVFFDIPERQKSKRVALRIKLHEMGFVQWQKSVFLYPYPCRDQIDFVVEFFNLRPYVRYAVMSDVTNEAELLLHFNLKPAFKTK